MKNYIAIAFILLIGGCATYYYYQPGDRVRYGKEHYTVKQVGKDYIIQPELPADTNWRIHVSYDSVRY